ncbi:arylsulfotransferase family protein [Planctomycetota bacterium]
MARNKVNKIFISLPLVWAVLCLIAAFGGYPFIYIVSFCFFCYFALFLAVKYAVWLLLPRRLKKTLKKHKMAFNLIIFGGLILLFLGHQAFNALLGSFRAGDDVSNTTPSLDNLGTLPYLDWVPAKSSIEKIGVTKYDPNLIYPGLNLYSEFSLPQAHLLDMSGKILHTWQLDTYTRRFQKNPIWPLVEMGKNGDLLALSVDTMLVRLDWESRVRWKTQFRAHHDFCQAQNDDIYALGREDGIVFIKGIAVPILEDYVMVLSPEGQIKNRFSITKIFKDEIRRAKITKIYKRLLNPRELAFILWRKINGYYLFEENSAFDVFHANSIKLMKSDIDKLCRKGDYLLSLRNRNWLVILDHQDQKVLWRWGPGEIQRQHHATHLDLGNIQIFDNGPRRRYSRIIELDLLDKKIVWEYHAESKEDFFSSNRGSCQRLPNGNTLITDSGKGRVFEVTPGGDKVWEYYNPYIRESTGTRRSIYRMMRIADPENYPSLRRFR